MIFLEERGNAVDVVRIPAELCFHLLLRWIDHVRLRHLLDRALLQKLGVGLEAVFGSRILPQTNNSVCSAPRCDLVIQQFADAVKDCIARIEEWDLAAKPKILPSKTQIKRLQKNVQVLFDAFVCLLGLCRLEVRDDSFQLAALGHLFRKCGIGDQRVELAEALLRRPFRRVLEHDVQHPLGVGVAARDRGGIGGCLYRGRKTRGGEERTQTKSRHPIAHLLLPSFQCWPWMTHGSFSGGASSFCGSSIEMPSGERTSVMWPSRSGRA